MNPEYFLSMYPILSPKGKKKTDSQFFLFDPNLESFGEAFL